MKNKKGVYRNSSVPSSRSKENPLLLLDFSVADDASLLLPCALICFDLEVNLSAVFRALLRPDTCRRRGDLVSPKVDLSPPLPAWLAPGPKGLKHPSFSCVFLQTSRSDASVSPEAEVVVPFLMSCVPCCVSRLTLF